MLDLLRKEKPDRVILTASPFGLEGNTYADPESIDRAMFDRYQGRKHFKVGQTERVVYQRVSGLKRVNANHSILYNFCSEGAFSDLGLPVTLCLPSADESVRMLAATLKKEDIITAKIFANVKL